MLASLRKLEELVANLPTKGDLMTATDDLKAAVAALNTSVSNEIAAITAKLSTASGDVSAADAEGVVSQLTALKTTLDTETAALTGSVPAPASPPAA